MESLSKFCPRCKNEQPVTEFYKIRNSNSYVSYCKACMKKLSKKQLHSNKDYQVPYVESEKIAIEYLNQFGIPVLPGKALRKSFVDAVAFGCVGIEVKYSKLHLERGTNKFTFQTTPTQRDRGFLGDVVMLICDFGDKRTFHFFDVGDDVFYMDGRLKTGFTFTPGAYEPRKFGETRTVMTQGMMDAAQDDLKLIYIALRQHVGKLKGA